jgi:phage-related protein
MTTPVFTWPVDYNATPTYTPAVKSVKYGDGYELRQQDGINNLGEDWDVQFTNRDPSEANQIRAFLKTQNGISKFQWITPYGDTFNFICRSWTAPIVRGNIQSITAKFEQVFES